MTEDSEYQWVLNKLPTWQILELEDAGIPLEFNVEDLTEEQRFTINFIGIMQNFIDQGRVEVLVEGREVRYRTPLKGGV